MNELLQLAQELKAELQELELNVEEQKEKLQEAENALRERQNVIGKVIKAIDTQARRQEEQDAERHKKLQTAMDELCGKLASEGATIIHAATLADLTGTTIPSHLLESEQSSPPLEATG